MKYPTNYVIDKYFPGKPSRAAKIGVNYKRKIDEPMVNSLHQFILNSALNMSHVGLEGVVVGLSGGLDSTTLTKLCKDALGTKLLTAVIVDLGLKEHKAQTKFAIGIAKKIGVRYKVIDGSALLAACRGVVAEEGPFTYANATTRAIHDTIFQVADSQLAAVASTIDKSELLLGRHMEYFYGHFAPFAGFYKTEVYDLARFVSVPNKVLTKEPGCVELWFDRKIFGVGYDVLDPIIYLLGEKNWSASRLAKKYSIDPIWLNKIEARVRNQKLRMQTIDFK